MFCSYMNMWLKCDQFKLMWCFPVILIWLKCGWSWCDVCSYVNITKMWLKLMSCFAVIWILLKCGWSWCDVCSYMNMTKMWLKCMPVLQLYMNIWLKCGLSSRDVLQLYEYDDVNDMASLTKASRNESDWRVYDLALVHWDDASSTSDVTLNTIEFRLGTNGTLNFHDNGSLSFKVGLSAFISWLYGRKFVAKWYFMLKWNAFQFLDMASWLFCKGKGC